jgi:hypothetical protein
MKIVAIAVLLLVGYFVWRFVVVGDGLVVITSDSRQKVVANVKQVIPEESILLEISNNDTENSITEISVSRQLVNRLGLSEPPGFREVPLPLAESDREDKETVEFVEEFNKETIRWVGSFVLEPNSATELAIPATSASDLQGYMDFQYEARVGFGGSLSFFRVHLAGQIPGR